MGILDIGGGMSDWTTLLPAHQRLHTWCSTGAPGPVSSGEDSQMPNTKSKAVPPSGQLPI